MEQTGPQITDRLACWAWDRWASSISVVHLATRRLALEEAPQGYEIFRDQAAGCIKIVPPP